MTWTIRTRTGACPGSNRPSAALLLSALFALAVSACASAPEGPDGAPAPGAGLHLTPERFAALPGWGERETQPALSALVQSCRRIAARPDDRAMNERAPYAGRAGDWRGVCAEAETLHARGPDEAEARRFFETRFTPMKVPGEGRLTGYYEPLVDVRRQPDTEYSMAIRAVPGGAFSGDLGQLIAEIDAPAAAAGLADIRRPRREIETRQIGAPLAWGRPIDVFFLQIQGSGRLVFEDGHQVRAAFAAHNDHPYVSIGRVLIDRGELDPNRASKQHIEDWLWRNGPDSWQPLFNENPRYVFFQLQPLHDHDLGPNGSQGAPLTPMASIAVDPAYHAWGVPVFVEADIADHPRWSGLVIAQDAGGAITGPVRGDLFYGWGHAAGDRAGRQNAMARWHVLLPNALAGRTRPLS